MLVRVRVRVLVRVLVQAAGCCGSGGVARKVLFIGVGLMFVQQLSGINAVIWAPEFGGRNGFPPPEKNELVLSIKMGCADTVPFQ